MRKLLLCAAAVSILLTGCGGGGGGASDAPTPAPSPPSQATTQPRTQPCPATIYGDSIAYGHFYNEKKELQRLERPPAAQLSETLPHLQLVDRSVSGVSLRQLRDGYNNPFVPDGKPRGRFDAEARTGKVVIIENGIIDVAIENPPASAADTVAILAELVAVVRREGRVPVVTGLAQMAEGKRPDNVSVTPEDIRRRNELYTALVRWTAANDVIFADMGSAAFDGSSDLADGIHPKQAYSNRMYTKVAEAVAKACAAGASNA